MDKKVDGIESSIVNLMVDAEHFPEQFSMAVSRAQSRVYSHNDRQLRKKLARKNMEYKEREEKRLESLSRNGRLNEVYLYNYAKFTSIFPEHGRIHVDTEGKASKRREIPNTFDELKKLRRYLGDPANVPVSPEGDRQKYRMAQGYYENFRQQFPSLDSIEVRKDSIWDDIFPSQRAISRLKSQEVRGNHQVIAFVFEKATVFRHSVKYFSLKEAQDMFQLLKQTVDQANDLMDTYLSAGSQISELWFDDEKKWADNQYTSIQDGIASAITSLYRLAYFLMYKALDQKELRSCFEALKEVIERHYESSLPIVQQIHADLRIVTDPLAVPIKELKSENDKSTFLAMMGCNNHNELKPTDLQLKIESEKIWLSGFLRGTESGKVSEQLTCILRLHTTVRGILEHYIQSDEFTGQHCKPIEVLSAIYKSDIKEDKQEHNLEFMKQKYNLALISSFYAQRIAYLLHQEEDINDFFQQGISGRCLFLFSGWISGKLKESEQLQSSIQRFFHSSGYAYDPSTIESHLMNIDFLSDIASEASEPSIVSHIRKWLEYFLRDRKVSFELADYFLSVSLKHESLKNHLMELFGSSIFRFSESLGDAFFKSEIYSKNAKRALVEHLVSGRSDPTKISVEVLPKLCGWISEHNIDLHDSLIAWKAISPLWKKWMHVPNSFFEEFKKTVESTKILWLRYVKAHVNDVPDSLLHYEALIQSIRYILGSNSGRLTPDILDEVKRLSKTIHLKKNIMIANHLVASDPMNFLQTNAQSCTLHQNNSGDHPYKQFIDQFESCFVFLIKYQIFCGDEDNQVIISAVEKLRNIFHEPNNQFQAYIRQESKSHGSPWFCLLQEKPGVISDRRRSAAWLVLEESLDINMKNQLTYPALLPQGRSLRLCYQFFLASAVWGCMDSNVAARILPKLITKMEGLSSIEGEIAEEDRLFLGFMQPFRHTESFFH